MAPLRAHKVSLEIPILVEIRFFAFFISEFIYEWYFCIGFCIANCVRRMNMFIKSCVFFKEFYLNTK